MVDINGTRIEKIARSELAAAAQRIAVIVGTPLFVAALGWIGVQLVGLDGRFSEIKGAVNTRAAELQGAIDRVSDKVEGVDRRVNRLEGWRDTFPMRR